MKSKVFALLVVSCLTVALPGCVKTLDGHMKAGWPTKDKIESRYERPMDQIYTAAKSVLAFNGVLTGDNTIQKVLEAKVNTRTVFVQVKQVDPKISMVVVQARTKWGGTDIDLASEIDKQIALQLQAAPGK